MAQVNFQPQILTLPQRSNYIRPQAKPLTYAEWLAQRGGGNPYAPAPQQQQQPSLPISEILEGFSGSEAASTGSAAAEGAASQEAWNAAATEAGGGLPAQTGILANFQSMGIGPQAGIIAGTALAGKAAYDMLKGKTPKGASGKFGRAQLGVATGGLSEVANKAKGMLGFGHKTTRDRAKENTAELEGVSPDDPVYQAYVRGMREQYNSGPTDPSKPFAGKYGSWDEYKKAGLEASDLTGVHGNISAYGPEWAKLSQQQRQAVTQANIDADNYRSKKGEVELTDTNKGREIFERMKASGFQVPIATAAPMSPTPMARVGMETTPAAPVMIPRSKTRSPGIDLNGNRIKY